MTGNNSLWLGITVGTDDEMAPRVQLGSVPFAVQALTVPDGSITTAKLATGAVVTTTLADGSVTTAKLAAGSVVSTTLADGAVPKLLGWKTCSTGGASNNCPEVIETGTSWQPVKGASAGDFVEITVTTHGRPIMTHMTTYFWIGPGGTGAGCAISVWQNGTQIDWAHLDGSGAAFPSSVTSNFMCSGGYLFDLPAGTYTFRAMGWIPSGVLVRWNGQRQIVAYEW